MRQNVPHAADGFDYGPVLPKLPLQPDDIALEQQISTLVYNVYNTPRMSGSFSFVQMLISHVTNRYALVVGRKECACYIGNESYEGTGLYFSAVAPKLRAQKG